MSGPLPRGAAPLAVPASWLYRLAVAARNARYDAGRGVVSVGAPVVSVGNLTTGGTGKTPAVAWIARLLRRQGIEPVIAMRGYGFRPGEAGDEAQEHREANPGVAVLADPDRAGALRSFLGRHPAIGCVLLDDGFQHRRLRRDVDLVLIDATRDGLGDRLLPAGRLREPPGSLRRADAVLVTRAASRDAALAGEIERFAGRPPLAWSRHAWSCLCVYAPGAPPAREPPGWLAGRRVVTLLGVGNPEDVRGALRSQGATIARDLAARDHERYGAAKLRAARRACAGADALVMTAKDWVKARDLIDLSGWPAPVVVPRVHLDVFDGAGALRTLILDAVRRPAAPTPGPD